MIRRMRVMTHISAILLLLVVAAACHRQTSSTESFVKSLRCGMTRVEVSQLAREHGYSSSDASWLTRAASSKSKQSKELILLDFTFREGRLVAVRRGTYDPRTKTVAYRTIDLCAR